MNIAPARTLRHSMLGVGCAILALLVSSSAVLRAADASRPAPNIILILADDMGYSDPGCYGGEIETPNIDSLATGGLRFRQYYNNAKCGPTRTSLLTGQYESAVGGNSMGNGITFGELLRSAGYRTICSGKWHQPPIPTTRGFDRYYGLADGCCNYFNPGTKARPGEGLPGRKESGRPRRWVIEDKVVEGGYTNPDKEFYTTDAFTTYAIERLEEYKGENKPFLLYLPYTAPHYPLQAWPADIAKYRGKYMKGWDQVRAERYERMIKLGIIDAKCKLSPRADGVKAWDSLSAEEQDQEDLKMAIYAAMVDRMDQNLGRIFKKVKELGQWDNTLIMFGADNGACDEQDKNRGNKAYKGPPGPVESYAFISRGWANASNTPYKQFKCTDFEGGTRGAFIAHWPGVIKPGSLSDQVIHVIDMLPTMMDIAGAKYPAEFEGRKINPISGRSLLPILKGTPWQAHEALFWEYEPRLAGAVRKGDWKLVKHGKGNGSNKVEGDWELYNMLEDRTELNNLAKSNPEIVRELSALWEKWKVDGSSAGKINGAAEGPGGGTE